MADSEPAGRTVLSRRLRHLGHLRRRRARTDPRLDHPGHRPVAGHRAPDPGRTGRLGCGRADRPGAVRIGLHLWRLGSLAPQGRELRDVALPYLQDLLEVTHEVVHLVVLDENQALYVEKLESRPGVLVVSQVGGRLPLHATGPGKVLLAHAPPGVLDEVIAAGLPRYAAARSPIRPSSAAPWPISASPATASPARR